ncbi:L-rhamnose mutarotase [Stakelama pacifica]|uniref:D-galactarate dehydratase/altronate hydrolase n=1 Tax=Stakelama pacifica TaxID=517720 RepID=A0A4V3BTU9_9SPHN|nr:L-rhamnose mutarotase [Stakelama pacifica]TDN84678.1 D-galactarate dehydratase/altronate hydrolase [Stakelama pacifica]GGO93094.1 hypothetical protein GCM10011329_11690 [Stakelama pacifica]
MAKPGKRIEALERTLTRYARYPNFGGALMIGVGCEVAQIEEMLARYDLASGERLRAHVLLPDPHDHADLIAEYERHYAPGMAWPEITDSIRRSGIQEMRIYRLGVRLVMVMRTDDDFDFERTAAADAADPPPPRSAGKR